ncbi:MAG TPA: hypothetical protein VH598_15575, partial [Verrucomicrobiae bacterium]|jgi:hypothetical protein|nr:hypothetical protein [Verrucomicrobiae bacterium]
MNEPISPPAATNPLSELEIAGAICALVIHDLSNHVSGIVGNAEYATHVMNDPERLQKAIQGISQASHLAGKLLEQCLPLQRRVATSSFPCETAEQAELIAETRGLAPGWRLAGASGLTGSICAQPRWLAMAVWQIVRETEAEQGEIQFACGPAVFPVVWRGAGKNPGRPPALFQITLRYRAGQTLLPDDGSIPSDRPALLAALELIRLAKGQVHCRSIPPGRQEISVLIPLL